MLEAVCFWQRGRARSNHVSHRAPRLQGQHQTNTSVCAAGQGQTREGTSHGQNHTPNERLGKTAACGRLLSP
uniref:Uncharacterized protein n=1 Tax=Knipowitschia caucasica TaxID=637954 RepID=A0AAV2JRS4_KNICA